MKCLFCEREPALFNLKNTVSDETQAALRRATRDPTATAVLYDIWFCSIICIWKWAERMIFGVVHE